MNDSTRPNERSSTAPAPSVPAFVIISSWLLVAENEHRSPEALYNPSARSSYSQQARFSSEAAGRNNAAATVPRQRSHWRVLSDPPASAQHTTRHFIRRGWSLLN
eukprot:scaffold9790_cov40-Attheya_sp.AAC.2